MRGESRAHVCSCPRQPDSLSRRERGLLTSFVLETESWSRTVTKDHAQEHKELSPRPAAVGGVSRTSPHNVGLAPRTVSSWSQLLSRCFSTLEVSVAGKLAGMVQDPLSWGLAIMFPDLCALWACAFTGVSLQSSWLLGRRGKEV